MMENPVSRPIVPPIADKMSTNFTLLSLVIMSYVGVSKKILTNCKSGSNEVTIKRGFLLLLEVSIDLLYPSHPY